MRLLILATHNAGKVAELSSLLQPLGYEVRSSAELGIPSPEENGTTFLENARIKALSVRDSDLLPAGSFVLADDSGLCVAHLQGKPGVQTSEYGGFVRLLDEMATATDRSAYFTCQLVLLAPDGTETTVEGRVDGRISAEIRGDGGFGYDPVFIPESAEKTFAEMSKTEKSVVSHRGRALRNLLEYLS